MIFRDLSDRNHNFTALVDLVIIHTDYDNQTNANDMALVHVNMSHVPTNVYKRFVPVCMPASDLSIVEGMQCRVIGHGFVSKEDELSNKSPDNLHGGNVRIASNRDCAIGDDDEASNKTCCVRDGHIHPCQGDSGGPLLCMGSSPSHVDGGEEDDEYVFSDADDDHSVLMQDEGITRSPRKWYLVGVASHVVSDKADNHNCGFYNSAVFGLVSTHLD